MKNSIENLLNQQKELKAKEDKIKQELKAKKIAIQKEFTESIDETTRQEIVKNAEEILLNAKQDTKILVESFKAQKQAIKANVSKAKEMLSLVNHVLNSSNGIGNGKVKNSLSLDGNILDVVREGFENVSVDVSKDDWQKALKASLESIGIENGVARNVCYKASLLVKSNS